MADRKNFAEWKTNPIKRQIGKSMKALEDSRNDEVKFNKAMKSLNGLIDVLWERSRKLDAIVKVIDP